MSDPYQLAQLALALLVGAGVLDIVIGKLARRYRHWRGVRRAQQKGGNACRTGRE